MRRSTRKPRLNQEPNRWRKSRSSTERPRSSRIASMRSARMATSAAVAAGRAVQPAKQLLAARLRGVVDFGRGGLAAGHAPARHRALDPGAVGAEVFRQRAKEGALVLVAEAPVAAENLARQRDPGGFAATADQRAAHVGERSRPVLGVARPRAELEHRASALGDRGEEVGKERVVHAASARVPHGADPASRGADRTNGIVVGERERIKSPCQGLPVKTAGTPSAWAKTSRRR